MKVKTHTGQGYIYFVYEDYYGMVYKSYNEIRKEMDEGNIGYLIGYHYSHYYGCGEPIDEIELNPLHRPTYTEVKQFIDRCRAIMNN